MVSLRFLASVLVFAILLIGCSNNAQSSNPIGDGPQATFTWISKNVIGPRCVICHNDTKPRGKVSFESYESLMASPGNTHKPIVAGDASTSGMYLETSEQKMPPEPYVLNAAEKTALHDWIANGAKEKTPVSAPGATPDRPTTVVAAPSTPQPTWEWLSKNALRRCATCHGAPFTPGKVDFTSYAALMASTGIEKPAVVAGDPENSGIYHEVAAGAMPPERHPLDSDELKAVQQWIQDGAKNN